MKYALAIFASLGMVCFAILFTLTFSMPGFVEDIGKSFIKQQVQKSTNEFVDKIALTSKDSSLAKFAQKLIDKNTQEIAQTKNKLKYRVGEKLAKYIAEMRDLDCECRKKYAQSINASYQSTISSLTFENAKLESFIKTNYMTVVDKLKLDIRQFAAANFFAFVLVLIVVLLKPRALIQLFVPAILLMISTVICSYFYLFEQNWFFTIIYDDFLGWTYLAYLMVVFGFFLDIVLNKAKVTTEIVNAIFEAIGSALTAVPC